MHVLSLHEVDLVGVVLTDLLLHALWGLYHQSAPGRGDGGEGLSSRYL
jgi:hypothetical protein